MVNQIVAFDVETPNSYNDRICAIGLTVIQDGLIIDSLYYLVNPEVEFTIQIIRETDFFTFPEACNATK